MFIARIQLYDEKKRRNDKISKRQKLGNTLLLLLFNFYVLFIFPHHKKVPRSTQKPPIKVFLQCRGNSFSGAVNLLRFYVATFKITVERTEKKIYCADGLIQKFSNVWILKFWDNENNNSRKTYGPQIDGGSVQRPPVDSAFRSVHILTACL